MQHRSVIFTQFESVILLRLNYPKMNKLEKLIVLKYHRLLTRFGIFSIRFGKKVTAYLKLLAPFYILLSLISFILSCAVFIYQNDVDFNETLRSCFHIVAISQAIGMFYCYGINVNRMQAIHHKLQELVDQAGKYFHIWFLLFHLKYSYPNSVCWSWWQGCLHQLRDVRDEIP